MNTCTGSRIQTLCYICIWVLWDPVIGGNSFTQSLETFLFATYWCIQYITGFTTMRYINRLFTYFLTYYYSFNPTGVFRGNLTAIFFISELLTSVVHNWCQEADTKKRIWKKKIFTRISDKINVGIHWTCSHSDSTLLSNARWRLVINSIQICPQVLLHYSLFTKCWMDILTKTVRGFSLRHHVSQSSYTVYKHVL